MTTPSLQDMAREWLDKHVGAWGVGQDGSLTSLLTRVRDMALEDAAAKAAGHRILGPGSPGPLYTAGANQNAEWIADEIRLLKSSPPAIRKGET